MHWIAQTVVRPRAAWTVIAVVAVVAVTSIYQASRLEHEDDILAFLPQDNPDVALFGEINQRFGTTEVALVGLEVFDPFDGRFLSTLQRVTRTLDEYPQLNHVMSLTNVVDFEPDPVAGGIITAPLVRAIPSTPTQTAALREKVMSREHVVGTLIAADASAVLLHCYLVYGADPRVAAQHIRQVVDDAFPHLDKYWGGGPFVSTYVYNTTRADLRRLTPWAILAVIAIMMIAFRDLVGTGVVLISTAIGAMVSLGIMAWFGVRFNIVLSAMPVVLFAIGSAYGVHVLARFFALCEEMAPELALGQALCETGPIVIAAGLTTAVSLLSFLTMDIQPLRTFGLFTAIGIVASMVLAITFVPAVVSLARLRRGPSRSRLLRLPLARITVFAQRRRRMVGALLASLALVGAGFIGRVNTGVDFSTFFSAGSPPDQAERFLTRHFGGGQFVQLHVMGDLTDPHVLREIRFISDQIATLPDVTSVVHAGDALARSNEAMNDQLRIPETAEQVKTLLTFMDDPAISQLITADRQQGIVLVKIHTNRAPQTDALLEQIERIVDQSVATSFDLVPASDPAARARIREQVVSRVLALGRFHNAHVPSGAARRIRDSGVLDRTIHVDPAPVAAAMARFLRSEESAAPLPRDDPDMADRLAKAVTALGPLAQPSAGDTTSSAPAMHADAGRLGAAADSHGRTLATTLANAARLPIDHLLVQDLVAILPDRLAGAWAWQRAHQVRMAVEAEAGIEVPQGRAGERFRAALTATMLELDRATVMIPSSSPSAGRPLRIQVNGLPVMHRGLSASVRRNQLYSLVSALTLVLVIMSFVLRSVAAGLLATAPTLLTLLLVYGGMGLTGVHLDIGTSMLACLVLGAGVDYALHLVSAWKAPAKGSLEDAAAEAAAHTGPAIWINAVMIAAGFAVLTLGTAKPLQNVGSLTAASLMTAAAATFLTIPVLARRRSYGRLGAEEIADADDGALVGEKPDLPTNTNTRS